MASTAQYIDRVRRKVGDFEEPRKLDKDYYIDALSFALSKLSSDLDTNFTSLESIPPDKEFFIVKLATIEMCYVLASSSFNKISEEDGTDRDDLANISRYEVPDLRIEAVVDKLSEVSEAYLNLAKELQKEYDGEIRHLGGSSLASYVQQGYLNVFSIRTGGLANQSLDRGIPPTTLAVELDGSTAKLSWNKIFHPEFHMYEITRVIGDEEEVLARMSDNQKNKYTHEVHEGSSSYRVYTVNRNGVRNVSNTIDIEVE